MPTRPPAHDLQRTAPGKSQTQARTPSPQPPLQLHFQGGKKRMLAVCRHAPCARARRTARGSARDPPSSHPRARLAATQKAGGTRTSSGFRTPHTLCGAWPHGARPTEGRFGSPHNCQDPKRPLLFKPPLMREDLCCVEGWDTWHSVAELGRGSRAASPRLRSLRGLLNDAPASALGRGGAPRRRKGKCPARKRITAERDPGSIKNQVDFTQIWNSRCFLKEHIFGAPGGLSQLSI